ncbi:MAG: hypothetical protein KAS23_08605, partial [Anaerohalosphaera sp.]|nr:hypothetical protein [Anaerohalosphaera sp.]
DGSLTHRYLETLLGCLIVPYLTPENLPTSILFANPRNVKDKKIHYTILFIFFYLQLRQPLIILSYEFSCGINSGIEFKHSNRADAKSKSSRS